MRRIITEEQLKRWETIDDSFVSAGAMSLADVIEVIKTRDLARKELKLSDEAKLKLVEAIENPTPVSQETRDLVKAIRESNRTDERKKDKEEPSEKS